jgi:hypothetical protein
MITIIWPLLIAVAGALVYAFAANPKLAEIGRILFFCGVLWTVYMLTGSTFAIGAVGHDRRHGAMEDRSSIAGLTYQDPRASDPRG